MKNITMSRRAFGASLAGLGAFAIIGRAAPSFAAPVALRLSSSLPSDPNSAHWLWYDKFQSALKAKVGDAIQIQYFPDNQLGKEADIVGQVKLGIVDMMISGSSIWGTLAPEVGVLDLGYLFDNISAAGPVLDGNAGTVLNGIFADKIGVEVLSWAYSFGGRNIAARKPANTPELLKGQKIRVLPVANFVATLQAMGAAPTPMSLGEVYTALQTGVIDGMEHDAPTILALKCYEVAKHISLTQHICNPQTIVIGKRALSKIPAETLPAFKEAAAEATAFQRGKANDIETAAFATLKKNGIETHEVDRAAFKKLVQPLWNDFATKYPATKPVLDAIVKA
ncbi:TRAP transporter substrate-binding protein [Rhizobium rhizogenes]|uniref:TRAP transporter substrate-binding protein n=1 Tax=Rhizobium rhizogenes TaxID=359 RepID=UPI0015725B5F|nr:TRAP transporter substrate-binding protein [Rhizobium rhizogenes]NTF45988.1 TRAP transporter substrate-binding protein [Rhizobium rhizogenes]